MNVRLNHVFRFRSGIGVGLVLLILFMTGCASSPHTWIVRTSSTPFPPSSDLASMGQEAVALFTPLATPAIRGNEAGLGLYLDGAIKKAAPAWKIIDEQQTINLINRHGLAGEYARLREGAEQSHILDRVTSKNRKEYRSTVRVSAPQKAAGRGQILTILKTNIVLLAEKATTYGPARRFCS